MPGRSIWTIPCMPHFLGHLKIGVTSLMLGADWSKPAGISTWCDVIKMCGLPHPGLSQAREVRSVWCKIICRNCIFQCMDIQPVTTAIILLWTVYATILILTALHQQILSIPHDRNTQHVLSQLFGWSGDSHYSATNEFISDMQYTQFLLCLFSIFVTLKAGFYLKDCVQS